MSFMRQVQARSTPDEIAAGIKWERVKIQVDDPTEEVDRALIGAFVMLVWDDAAWVVEECDDNNATLNGAMVEGQSLSVEDARRDATLALLGACEAAQFFFCAQQEVSVASCRILVAACDETARLIREAALNT